MMSNKDELEQTILAIDKLIMSQKYFDYISTRELLIARNCVERQILQKEEEENV